MKTIVYLISLILVTSCNSQIKQGNKMKSNKELSLEELKTKGYQIKEQDTFMVKEGKLDIKMLEETGNKRYTNANGYYFETKLNNGTHINIYGDELNGYSKRITKKDDYLQEYYEYYPSGVLKQIGLLYPDLIFKGTWFWYNKKGVINKLVEYDNPYSYTWENVLVFIKEKKIKKEDIYRIYRDVQKEKGTQKPYWYISKITAVDGLKSPTSIIKYTLDGNTGKILKEETVDVTRHLE